MNHYNKIIPFDICRVADVGDVPLKNSYSIRRLIRILKRFLKRSGRMVPILLLQEVTILELIPY
jgi:hypothetical protein